jgi:putative ABC transport system permease protein
MRKLVVAGVRHNRARYLATFVAIVTGVAFFTATGFLSAGVVESLEGDAKRQYAEVDVAIVPAEDDPAADSGHPGGAFTIDGRVADDVAETEGVEAVGGTLTGAVAFKGSDGKAEGEGATGRLWVTDEQLNPLEIEEGAAPEAPGEIAIDRGLAEDLGYSVGDEVTILTLAGESPATVVGITRFGDSDALDDGGTVSISEDNAFDWLNSGQVEYEELFVRGSDSQVELAERIEPLVPDGFEAVAGTEFIEEKASSAGSIGRYLRTALQAFAILALLVGGFVIFNTFNVIVAQRTRELGVMAAIGATPSQIKRSLRLEGALLGVLGSVAGVLVGILLAFVLEAVLSVVGADLASGGPVVGAGNVVAGVLLGTIITIASVSIPARRAGRIEPIEAIRSAAVESAEISRKRRLLTAGLLIAGSLLLLAGPSAAVIGIGGILFMAGVIVAGPIFAVLGARILRRPMSHFGLEGRLAVDNAARNPKRTATTANALLIGVFLVSFTVFAGTSVKDFAVGEIKKLESADYIIASDGGTIDEQLVSDLATVDGVEAVVPFRREAVTIDGVPQAISTGDLTEIESVADVEVADGSLDRLAAGEIAILDPAAAVQSTGEGNRGGDLPQIGSTVAVKNGEGQSVELEVVAILAATIDGAQVGSFVSDETFDSFVGDTAPTAAFIDAESGERTDTKDRIEELVDLRPDVEAQEGNAIANLIGGIFDFIINAVIGLLMMSVVIALIGIVNTMSLSIIERRRELGLLRIVGMTDERIHKMIRLESVIVASLGTVTGLFAGLFCAFCTIFAIDRLADTGLGLTIHVSVLVLVLVSGALLGLLASLIPARRSTNLDVLDALDA